MSVVELVRAVTILCSALGVRSFEVTADAQRRFPDDFLFGAATAAYQIEGGWNADGKGESIWDHMVHSRPEMIADGTNGDVAADTYHNYKRDVEMASELGLNIYRFSIAWTRILPSGFPDQVSAAGVAFYDDYIDEMLKRNITPAITLYHWDLPQTLQDLGGWANPLVATWFADYARVAFDRFGDRVKLWITINEPREICMDGYGGRSKAPAVGYSGIAEYLCVKNLLMAHASAWRVYDEEFRARQGGKCGITISVNWVGPSTNSSGDRESAELLRQAQWKIFAHPIYSKEGDYPNELKERIASKSAAQGCPRSRLPAITPEEVEFIRGTSDFFGMNHYSGRFVSKNDSQIGIYKSPSFNDDFDGISTHTSEDWIQSNSSWLLEVPFSLYETLKYVRDTYDDPDIYITENGWSTDVGLEDDSRIRYYHTGLRGVLNALQDGVKVKSFMAWSLMDNFEWLDGLKSRFGLYEVNYTDPARTRTPRKSALVYKEIIRTRILDNSYEPTASQSFDHI